MEDAMAAATKARAVGFNHVAIEVGDIDAALAFYSRLFEFHHRSKSDSMAFIDLGDGDQGTHGQSHGAEMKRRELLARTRRSVRDSRSWNVCFRHR
jgi:catechol 2,3-dioxygenase-like lactoylglutathione lyase family enzyme